MPSDPKECRQRALRCTELAEKSTDPELKAVLISLVERWLKLAADLERAQALRDEREPRPTNEGIARFPIRRGQSGAPH
jgi:hypothetical protein